MSRDHSFGRRTRPGGADTIGNTSNVTGNAAPYDTLLFEGEGDGVAITITDGEWYGVSKLQTYVAARTGNFTTINAVITLYKDGVSYATSTEALPAVTAPDGEFTDVTAFTEEELLNADYATIAFTPPSVASSDWTIKLVKYPQA